MRSTLNRFKRLTQGPHGALALAMTAASCVVVALILLGSWFHFWPIAIALAAGTVCLMLTMMVSVLSRLRGKLNDVHYALSLENGLRRAGYDVKEFFTDAAAASPSLQLYSLKVLLFCQPRRILELGSGQSTKLISEYARQNPSIDALTLEQDEAWIQRLGVHVTHDYQHAPLEPKTFACRGSGLKLETRWYRDLPALHAGKFDYILVDGPDPGTLGTEHVDYSRSGILQFMPDILADSFVVIFDDAERLGEQMTTAAFAEILRACGIRHICFTIHGIKDQMVFCSPDRAFLRSI